MHFHAQLTEIFTFYETIRDCPADTLTRFFFVPVISCAIEKAISGLDGMVNRLN